MTPQLIKNISKFPIPIQDKITEFANKLMEGLKDNLEAVLIYGSAAGTNYQHGLSNINAAVIVKKLDFSVLSQSRGVVKWGHKYRFATPLFLTKEYILNSLDVFPIEFSEIRQQHQVVFGEDIFKDLEIPFKDVRLLCEQQVKGKLLHLQQAYLDIGPNAVVLKNLLLTALNHLIPIFRQLIILKGKNPSEQKEEIIGELCAVFSLDKGSFLAVYQDSRRKILISHHQVESHFQDFLNVLEKLSRQMDSL